MLVEGETLGATETAEKDGRGTVRGDGVDGLVGSGGGAGDVEGAGGGKGEVVGGDGGLEGGEDEGVAGFCRRRRVVWILKMVPERSPT